MGEFNTRWDDNTVVTVGITLDGKVGIVIDDGQEEGCGLATPAEWDAFVAAGNAALGRPAPTSTPLEERLADAARAAKRTIYRRDDIPPSPQDAAEEAYMEALAMVREAGPTVPRAAVEALRDTILGWEKAALPGSYEDGRAQGLLDVVATIDTMLGTKESGHADD